MLLDNLLLYSQKFFKDYYEKSSILKKIDWFIYASILLLIYSSAILPSDSIAIFAIFAIIFTIVKFLTKPRAGIVFSSAEKLLLLYFIFVLISLAGSTLFLQSLKGFCKTLIYIGFYISVVNFLSENKSKIKYIILAIASVTFIEGLVAIKQNLISVSEISGWQDMSRLNPEQIMTRVYGTLKPYNPYLFGGYMLAALPCNLLLIFLPLINKHYKTAAVGLLCFVLALVTVVLTGCRGAYIALFVEMLMIASLTYKFLKPYYKKVFLLCSTFLTGLTATIIMILPALRARILSIFAMRADSSNSFRFNVYNSCIEMFKDNWLLGIGVGNQNFREIYGLYMRTGFDALSAYNIYLEIAVESGIFALISFLGFVGVLMTQAIRYIMSKKRIEVIYLSIALISLIGILFHGFVDTVFFRPQIQFLFWIMIAIIRVITASRRARYGRVRN